MKKNNPNNYKSILLFLLGIVVALVAGTFAYNGSKTNKFTNTNSNNYTCPMTKQTSTNPSRGGGCGMMRNLNTDTSTTNTRSQTNIDANISYENINAGHDEYSLIPETLNLTAGKSYKLTITPSADGQGCMNNMTIPGLDNNIYDIRKGTPINIIINNAKAGKYEVVCGNMGMHQGRIIIY